MFGDAYKAGAEKYQECADPIRARDWFAEEEMTQERGENVAYRGNGHDEAKIGPARKASCG